MLPWNGFTENDKLRLGPKKINEPTTDLPTGTSKKISRWKSVSRFGQLATKLKSWGTEAFEC